MSSADVYWEKKDEGYKRKKRRGCQNKRLTLDGNEGHML